MATTGWSDVHAVGVEVSGGMDCDVFEGVDGSGERRRFVATRRIEPVLSREMGRGWAGGYPVLLYPTADPRLAWMTGDVSDGEAYMDAFRREHGVEPEPDLSWWNGIRFS